LERRRRGYGDDEAEWVLIWQMRRWARAAIYYI
jgi:hypothetical protein